MKKQMLLWGTWGVKGMEIRTERGIVPQKHLKQPVTTDWSLCAKIFQQQRTRGSEFCWDITTIIHDKQFQMN